MLARAASPPIGQTISGSGVPSPVRAQPVPVGDSDIGPSLENQAAVSVPPSNAPVPTFSTLISHNGVFPTIAGFGCADRDNSTSARFAGKMVSRNDRLTAARPSSSAVIVTSNGSSRVSASCGVPDSRPVERLMVRFRLGGKPRAEKTRLSPASMSLKYWASGSSKYSPSWAT